MINYSLFFFRSRNYLNNILNKMFNLTSFSSVLSKIFPIKYIPTQRGLKKKIPPIILQLRFNTVLKLQHERISYLFKSCKRFINKIYHFPPLPFFLGKKKSYTVMADTVCTHRPLIGVRAL